MHEYNTECLVLAYLPYHTTPQFQALLSVLPANLPPSLRFLSPYIAPPTNPPRQAIVNSAANAAPVFAALQQNVVNTLQAGHQGPSLLSFWASVTTQAIDAMLQHSSSGRREIQDQRTEELLLKVFPTLNECLKVSMAPEAIMSCYMMIVVLVTKGTFGDKVLDSLMEAVIRSQRAETVESCMLCLAVIAEERAHSTLPVSVAKRLLLFPELSKKLAALSTKTRTRRLALGCALGALDTISRSVSSNESRVLLERLLESQIVQGSHATLVLATLLRLLADSPAGSPQHAQMLEMAIQLSESSQFANMLQTLIKDRRAEFESLGLSIASIDLEPQPQDLSEDEDMLDMEDVEANSAIPLPTISVTSFLQGNATADFQATVTAFQQVPFSSAKARHFLNSAKFGKSEAVQQPLYFTLLARTWCSPVSSLAKTAAINAATSTIKASETGTDLQNLLPYLLCALADSSSSVRRAAASCIRAISAKAGQKADVWGSTGIYGTSSKSLNLLPKGQCAQITSTLLIPILEECVLDPNFVIVAMRTIIEGSNTSKIPAAQGLKSSARAALVSFLTSHCALTPLLRVRLCLFPIFTLVGKSMHNARVNILLPAIQEWCSQSPGKVLDLCNSEGIAVADADGMHLAALMAKEPESVELLLSIISGTTSNDREELIDAAYVRLTSIWASLRLDTQLSVSEALLNLALKDSCTTPVEKLCKARSSETLRAVKLDTQVLVQFMESIPSAMQMPEGPPSKKRRRTSRSEMARMDVQSSDDVQKLLERSTLVLELVESSSPEDHPGLFKPLFGALSELQQLRQQSGSDLVYLQSLILGSLTPLVNAIKDTKEAPEYQAAVRVDLLVDTIRHSTIPQVQNASLLLIASLASWVPDLVLHNLMPIFTFMGSTLLRQHDDYSAHVVDQTISRIVPQLATSLRSKHKDFITGVADLLLSFTAAFEHIPQHRRLKLFSELARTLGPGDSLCAIIALLIDRYPTESAQRKFVPELLLNFEPVIVLEVCIPLLPDKLVTNSVDSERIFGTPCRHYWHATEEGGYALRLERQTTSPERQIDQHATDFIR